MEKCVGVVESPKGNIWNTMGVFNSGQVFITAEEALFLVEFHRFKLFDVSILSENFKKLDSTEDIMSLMSSNCGLTSYKVGHFIAFNSKYEYIY